MAQIRLYRSQDPYLNNIDNNTKLWLLLNRLYSIGRNLGSWGSSFKTWSGRVLYKRDHQQRAENP
ncbi:hypothetical protein MC7420_7443 [Coleofasciculus chthonoplastes PCC 7420]|uniref:Uncharacterized protein n=1 Tax=Coleofasciculus chthonoplastes PCC 7420 TaxID=118168 RepID=B4VHX6_9CYAN|nr:hypothetical protein MC7420_7443 [Coleofasciculus chthonoplastes PCC 7420]